VAAPPRLVVLPLLVFHVKTATSAHTATFSQSYNYQSLSRLHILDSAVIPRVNTSFCTVFGAELCSWAQDHAAPCSSLRVPPSRNPSPKPKPPKPICYTPSVNFENQSRCRQTSAGLLPPTERRFSTGHRPKSQIKNYEVLSKPRSRGYEALMNRQWPGLRRRSLRFGLRCFPRVPSPIPPPPEKISKRASFVHFCPAPTAPSPSLSSFNHMSINYQPPTINHRPPHPASSVKN
jgi:hypothetical protein